MTDIITTADKLACAKRELEIRKAVLSALQHKVSASVAAHEIAVMAAIVADYEDALIKESAA
jgi:hypothetical protein